MDCSWISAAGLEVSRSFWRTTGYDMIGVDNSEEMLELALEKKEQIRKRYPVSAVRICGNLNFTARWRRWSPSVIA